MCYIGSKAALTQPEKRLIMLGPFPKRKELITVRNI